MALDIVAWHDRPSSDYVTQLNNARAQGYSTISMCVYGDRTAPLYAASMVRRATQAQEQTFLSLNGADLDATINSMAQQGWGAKIISAIGPTNNPLFAAVFGPGQPTFLIYRATASDIASLNSAEMSGGAILGWTDAYGDPGNLRYIGIWVQDVDHRAWNADDIDDSYAAMQLRFNVLVTGGARPVLTASTPDAGVLTVYDDTLGVGWQMFAGMTSSDYQAKFNTLYPQGLRPVRVSAKGTGSAARFSVIFADSEDAPARTFRSNGPTAAVGAIDAAMEAVMTANMVRGASLAVVSGTRLVYARGYTFAEPGYPDIQPTTFFRQASVSKMFTAAALYQLMDQGAKLPGTNTLLTLDTALVDALPNASSGSPDPQWPNIKIRHLLEMTSGIRASVMGDSDSLVSSTLPITELQLAQWLSVQQIKITPGDPTQAVYSNAGFMLLGMIVARKWGAPDYITGLSTFLNRLQISRVRSSRSLLSAQPADEARYHPRPLQTWRSVMATGQPMCLVGYGTDNLENLAGGGGLSAAAPDVARVLAALNSNYMNPMMSPTMIQTWLQNAQNATSTLTGPGDEHHGYHGWDSVQTDPTTSIMTGEKGGSLSTSQNGVQFTLNGFATVINWNGPTPTGPHWFAPYVDLMKAVGAQSWGMTDLFPTFGMPALPTRPIPLPPGPRPLRVEPSAVKPLPSHMVPKPGPKLQV
jgi:CubicO group peptidase (beta-lactamase class C family)